MHISKFVMLESGTFNDPMLRPYRSHIDPSIVSQFQEATQGGANLSPAALSGIAGNIIRPAAQPSAAVAIDNGWDTRRFRFLMEVNSAVGYGYSNKQIISGYSDHAGFSSSGYIDPNMRLYFNNSVVLKTVGNNGVMSTMMGEATQILMSMERNNPMIDTKLVSMRPADVVAEMSAITLESGDVHDFRTGFFEGPKKSRRSNSIAPAFMSKVMTGLHQTFNNPEMNHAKSGTELYAEARDNIRDTYTTADPFMGKLMRECDYGARGFITYGELCRMFPETDSICIFTPAVKLTRMGIPLATRGDSEYWSVTTTEAVISTTLLHAVPSMMMDLMITKCTIVATNETHDGSIYIQLANPASFTDGIDMRPYLAQFEDRLRMQILRDITNNNYINFRLQMIVDVVGETRINISFAGQPEVEFVAPSFADGIMSPLITNSKFDLRTVATDLDNLYHNVSPMSMAQQYAPPAPQGHHVGYTSAAPQPSSYNFDNPTSPPKPPMYMG